MGHHIASFFPGWAYRDALAHCLRIDIFFQLRDLDNYLENTPGAMSRILSGLRDLLRNHDPISHIRLQGFPALDPNARLAIDTGFLIRVPQSVTINLEKSGEKILMKEFSGRYYLFLNYRDEWDLVIGGNDHVVSGTREQLMNAVVRMNPGDVLTLFSIM